MATTATAQVIMRTVVADKIVKTFEQDPVLLDMFLDGKNNKLNSLGAGIAAYVQENPSLKSLLESDYFPVPGETADVLMKITAVDQAQSGHISGRLLDIPDALMLEGALSRVTRDDTETFKKKLNQQSYMNGTGVLANVTARVTGVAGTATVAGALGVSRLIVGARVNFYTTAGVIHQAGGSVSVITAINPSTLVVTFDFVPTDAAGSDIIVAEGSYGLAFHGLAYHVNDEMGDYQGHAQARTLYSRLRAAVIDAGGGALSVSLIDRLLRTLRTMNTAGVNGTMDDIVMISHPDQQLAYEQLGYGLTRTVAASGNAKLDLGFPRFMHKGLRWKLDNDCPRDRMYFLRLSTFQTWMNRKPGLFIDANGDSLRLKPGSAVYGWDYQFQMLCSGDIGCTNPSANGVIKNLALVA